MARFRAHWGGGEDGLKSGQCFWLEVLRSISGYTSAKARETPYKTADINIQDRGKMTSRFFELCVLFLGNLFIKFLLV